MNPIKNIFPAFVIVAWLYAIFMLSQPVEIIAVHQDDLLVRNFPLTDKGKISWWKKNSAMLKAKYALDAGNSTINIWDFGEGYQTETPDKTTFFPSHDTDYLLCFDDMNVPERCIRKENFLMYLHQAADGSTWYTVEGGVYYQKENGPLVKHED